MVSHTSDIPTRTENDLLGNIYDVAIKIYKNYTLRVFLQAIVTVWAVTTFTFFLIRLMPGNPIDVLIEQILVQESVSYQEAYDRVAASFDFDPNQSTFEQYVDWLGDLVQLDLGTSITSPGTKVVDEIARFLPWTVFAVGSGLLISFILGILLGMVMAYYRGSFADHALSLVASFMTGVPNYIWGLLIIIVFGIQLNWINIGALRGTYDVELTPGFNLAFIGSVLKHAALPIFTYVISTLGSWMLNMKSSTMSVLNEDYVNVAEARGLQDNRIVTAYVGRNASLPLFTQLAISIGFVLGSGVVIEEIFVYWGLGHYLFASITTRDYTSMQGVFLILTVTVVFANLFSDLTYGFLDPRVRVSGER
ncbi:MAG: ABC transporter permease [Anaerolineae bacterium]|nr:ABC transporter permease [Anaerolineae bacterium]